MYLGVSVCVNERGWSVWSGLYHVLVFLQWQTHSRVEINNCICSLTPPPHKPQHTQVTSSLLPSLHLSFILSLYHTFHLLTDTIFLCPQIKQLIVCRDSLKIRCRLHTSRSTDPSRSSTQMLSGASSLLTSIPAPLLTKRAPTELWIDAEAIFFSWSETCVLPLVGHSSHSFE